MKVTHKALGTGTIVSQDAENVTVDFNGSVKTLVIKFARLTNEDGSEFGNTFVAPVKKAKKQNQANRNVASAFSGMTSEQKYAWEQKMEKAKGASKSW